MIKDKILNTDSNPNILYGSFQVAKYLGIRKDYVGFSNFFRFCGVPSIKNSKGVKVYFMTNGQAREFWNYIKNAKKIFRRD